MQVRADHLATQPARSGLKPLYTVHGDEPLLAQEAGLKMEHVPYRGETPMLQDMLGGAIPTPGDYELHKAGGVRDGMTGTLVPGAVASYAVWQVPGGADALDVTAPADAVQRWSTDPRSRVPALPPLGPDDELPTCLQTVHRGELIHG